MMKKIATLVLALGACAPAFCGVYTDAVSRCLANSTTGKDRTDLARWIFAGMAQHPEMSDMATLSLEKRETVNRTAGALYTRLMTESCKKELREAIQNEGEEAVKSSFEFLGKLAMQELLTNPQVGAAFRGVDRYADTEKIRSALQGK
jgi:hypothetical protein